MTIYLCGKSTTFHIVFVLLSWKPLSIVSSTVNI